MRRLICSLRTAAGVAREIKFRFQFAPADFGLILIDEELAIRPAQNQARAQWKDDRRPVNLSFNTEIFGSGGEGESECAVEDDRVGLSENIAGNPAVNFRFQEKGGGIRPIQCGGLHRAAGRSTGHIVLDSGEGTRSGDTRNTGIVKFVAGSGVNHG